MFAGWASLIYIKFFFLAVFISALFLTSISSCVSGPGVRRAEGELDGVRAQEDGIKEVKGGVN